MATKAPTAPNKQQPRNKAGQFSKSGDRTAAGGRTPLPPAAVPPAEPAEESFTPLQDGPADHRPRYEAEDSEVITRAAQAAAIAVAGAMGGYGLAKATTKKTAAIAQGTTQRANTATNYASGKANTIVCVAWAVVVLTYFTPLASILKFGVRSATGLIAVTAEVAEGSRGIANSLAPNITETPFEGERIADWVVTSTFGPRVSPCEGCSDLHRGVDLAKLEGATLGENLYAVHPDKGEKGELICWWDGNGGGLVATYTPIDADGETGPYRFKYLHLNACEAKTGGESITVKAGQKIGEAGGSGLGTGPHLDFRQEQQSGGGEWETIPPYKGFAFMAVSGREPTPALFFRGDNPYKN